MSLTVPLAVLLWIAVGIAALVILLAAVALVLIGIGLFRSIQRHRAPHRNPPFAEGSDND